MSSPLGRGLGAIIPIQSQKQNITNNQPSAQVAEVAAGERIVPMPIEKLLANPQQSRQVFDHAALEELVSSMKSHGILVPLVVTPAPEDKYYIIAGERRFRAAQVLGLKTLPVLIRDAGELERLELGLIENIQREDLNVLELAQAYKKLADDFSLTQEKIADRVGKARSSVANMMRLLQLPEPIQKALADNRINFGHAKYLLSIENPKRQQELFEKILKDQLSVRGIAITGEDTTLVKSHRRRQGKHPALEELEQNMQNSLGSKVRIRPSGTGGEIVITYYDAEELRRLSERLL